MPATAAICGSPISAPFATALGIAPATPAPIADNAATGSEKASAAARAALRTTGERGAQDHPCRHGRLLCVGRAARQSGSQGQAAGGGRRGARRRRGGELGGGQV